ncbi:MAG: hypothetical protein Athens101410_15 [Parcubacteria group bacterium Athens1014_10]|nr:MAG: hypothetical protein Athens101410_15 [Parcubacteria group bacterium Athens1014_10]TSD06041.1 MAG: hypothetical protein Athens071412_15 [Parcubacteria group bacterium Athens0714_12]
MPKLSKNPYYRILEIIPGALVWMTFILAFLFSYFKPLWAIYFIILFDLYWLIKIVYLQIHLIISWQRFKKTLKINWLERLKTIKDWPEIYHLIILPTYKEGIEVIKSTFENLIKMDYSLDKFIVVLAGEEKDKENFLKIVEEIKKDFAGKFFRLLIELHPKDLPGELAGKGSNTHYAGKKAKILIDQLKIPYKKIIVSSFDVDSCPHRQYFSYLTYTYLTHPDPVHASFQPIALFNNNIWDSPALTRIVSRGTTFWLLTELNRPERMSTFSSHSMSFNALVDVGFWQNDIVSEDSRIFYQCFIHYNGNYSVAPLYIPISMDTVYAGSLWQSLVNQYKQQRRWAYGAENIPYLIWNLWKNKKIPFKKGFKSLFILSEGIYSWATAPILIFVLGKLPLWLAEEGIKTSVLISNEPFILEILMQLAMVGLIISAVLSIILLPPRPDKYKFHTYLFMLLQWILFPICFIFFGAIPALDAQTRLMLGKYLGFWVTKKVRKSLI